MLLSNISTNRNTSTSRKAQILTYDFFTAMAIFIVVLTVVMGYWYYASVQIEETRERNRATNLLYLSSDVWFKEGYPKYWGATDVMEIGMSNGNRINETKMEILNDSISYSKLVSLLNLGVYNVQYTVYNSTRGIIFQFPSGVNLGFAKNVYNIERVGILDEKPVVIRTIIWD